MAQSNRLTNREWEVVKLLLQGKSNKLIASSLGISARTVEFHLKNIYAKYQVSSRIELILRLGNPTGKVEIEKLGYSTVDSRGESAENREAGNARTDWRTSFRYSVTMIGKELQMKNLLNTKHIPVGVLTALFTGFLGIALLGRYGHVSLSAIEPWVLPLVIILALIGISVGLMGKRKGDNPGKVFFSTLFGTGLGAFAMLPLTVIIAVPLGKLAERLGLINRAAMPSYLASMLVITSMLVMWLIVGTVVGSMLLYVTVKRPGQADIQRHAAEHGL
jgi:DNA-binding CsgD family transcriptional regulator